MSKKHHKSLSRDSNYINHLLIVTHAITGCVSISSFGSLVGIVIGIASPAIGLKACAITSGIKKYKSIIKKKKKKHDKVALSTKSKLNSIVSISNALTDSKISQDEFVLLNNVLNDLCNIKEEIKNSNNK